jgi:TldD protein
VTGPRLLAEDDFAAVRRAAGPVAGARLFAEAEETFRVKLSAAGPVSLSTRRAGTCVEVTAVDGQRFHVARPGIGSSVVARLARQVSDGEPDGPGPDGAGEARGIYDLTGEPQRRLLGHALREAADAVSSAGAVPGIEADITRHLVAVDDGQHGIRADDRWRVGLRVGARIREGSPRVMRMASAASVAGLINTGDHLRAAAEAAAAAALTGAVPVPAGEMPVVLGPGSPASLFHEVCGHGLEGDIACGPGGAYGPLLGHRVAVPSFTIADDPRIPAYAPLYARDDEGEDARETILVGDGVVTSVLADRATCGRLGRPATGNGRRVGYQHPALTRMSCTYVKAGDSEAAAALEGVRHGFYVAGIASGETTMSGESFQARVSEAYLIEHGAITRPVAPGAILSGRGRDLLGAVEIVCDDLRFAAYGFHCNKLGQYPLTVSVGQPTLRLRQLAVHP